MVRISVSKSLDVQKAVMTQHEGGNAPREDRGKDELELDPEPEPELGRHAALARLPQC